MSGTAFDRQVLVFVPIPIMFISCSNQSSLSMQFFDLVEEVQSNLFTAVICTVEICFEVYDTFTIFICVTKNANKKKGQSSQIQR